MRGQKIQSLSHDSTRPCCNCDGSARWQPSVVVVSSCLPRQQVIVVLVTPLIIIVLVPVDSGASNGIASGIVSSIRLPDKLYQLHLLSLTKLTFYGKHIVSDY